MAGCCDARGCDKVFGPRLAHQLAKRYRRRGLDRTSGRLVDWLVGQGIEGASVLEIGGGLGEIQLELLRRGAARTTNLELSAAYDAEATALAAEAGMTGRMDRRMGDIAVEDGVADVHDVVVLNRVVCCYPDVERLLGAAAQHARRAVILTHPPRHVGSMTVAAVENFLLRAAGREYRAFAHPPEVMGAVLRDHGLVPRHVHKGALWHVLTAPRATEASAS
jgi:magnesium-protoporphyrin O-methyltransferase